VTPSVFLSSDAGNPDTYRHFLSSEIASKENKWTGRNVTRWQSPEYDKLAELG
jgi:peptide/nickel transport system substrate-binding protein